MIGLEFGSGENPKRKNFKTVDVRNLPNVSYVCKSWEISMLIDENTVDEIFSRHFFEHLTFEQGRKTLTAWYNILKKNGKVEMIIPDMEHHIKQWLDLNRKTKEVKRSGGNNSTFQKEAIKGFWGGQRGDLEDTWDIHKSGYDFNLLKELLEQHGFKNVERIKDAPKNLHIVCYK